MRRSGEDRKWRELANLLNEIFTPEAIANHLAETAASYETNDTPKPVPSPRQKIVIFTEHRDTLNYLEKRISTLLGRSSSLVTIHGGMGREERMKAQESFKHDPDVQVLLLPTPPVKGSTCSVLTLWSTMISRGIPTV